MKKCIKCKLVKGLDLFYKHKKNKDGFTYACKECIKNRVKTYRNNNLEKVRKCSNKSNKIYRSKKENREKRNERRRDKRRSNSLYKVKVTLRKRTTQAFTNKGWHKGGPSEQLLGTDWQTAHDYVESTFTEGMTWENHGYGEDKWHIDHKIPLGSATNSEEMNKLCHYTNLQALWQNDNLIKSNKIC